MGIARLTKEYRGTRGGRGRTGYDQEAERGGNYRCAWSLPTVPGASRLGLNPKEERKVIEYTDKSGELSPAYVCTLLVWEGQEKALPRSS